MREPHHGAVIAEHIHAAWMQGATAAAAAEQACAADPGNCDLRMHWIACLLEANRPDEALTAAEYALYSFVGTAESFQLLMQKAEALHRLDNPAASIEVLAAALELRPEDELALEKICFLCLSIGRRESARPYQMRLQAIQERSLPDRLTDALAGIWERTADIELDPRAVEWAWELADRSVWERDAWQAAAAWGKEANLLLRRWWQTAPANKLRQIDELVDKPDISGFLDASFERGTCFLVGAHVGPTAAALNLFSPGNRLFRTLGSPDRGRRDDDTLIALTPDPFPAMRKLLDHLKNGATIGMMADTPYSREYLPTEFLGRYIELSTQVPKLLRRYAAASFWCCPLWRDGRITIELARLPDPVDDEAFGAWYRRWFAAYLAKLEAVMRSRPENLVLFSGIWAHINPTAVSLRHNMRNRRPVTEGLHDTGKGRSLGNIARR